MRLYTDRLWSKVNGSGVAAGACASPGRATATNAAPRASATMHRFHAACAFKHLTAPPSASVGIQLAPRARAVFQDSSAGPGAQAPGVPAGWH